MQGSEYGKDWSGPVATTDDRCAVFVPNLPRLTVQQRSVLEEELAHHLDFKFGVEHYSLARSFIAHCNSP